MECTKGRGDHDHAFAKDARRTSWCTNRALARQFRAHSAGAQGANRVEPHLGRRFHAVRAVLRHGNPHVLVDNQTTGDLHYDRFQQQPGRSISWGPDLLGRQVLPASPVYREMGTSSLLFLQLEHGRARQHANQCRRRRLRLKLAELRLALDYRFHPPEEYDVGGDPHVTAYSSSSGAGSYRKLLHEYCGYGSDGPATSVRAATSRLAFNGPPQVIAYGGSSGVSDSMASQMEGNIAAKPGARRS